MYKPKMVYESDFKIVQSQCSQNPEYKTGLVKFFEPGERSYSISSPTVIGAIAANELTDYVVSSFLPSTGAWIDCMIKDKTDAKEALKMQSMLADQLNKSNFYSEVQKCIFNTFVYGTSTVSIDYSMGGFSFNCIDEQEIYISADSNINNTRVYVKKQISGIDLKQQFKNPPSFLFNSSTGNNDMADTSLYWMTIGYVPDIDKFFNKASGKGYKMVHFLDMAGAVDVLEPVVEPEPFTCLPIAKFKSDMRSGSLGQMALPALIELDDMALRVSDYSHNVTHPSIEIDEEAIIKGQANVQSGGLIPLSPQARQTRAIEVGGNLPFGIEEKRALEATVRRIFKTDLIDQARIQELSSMHVAGYKLSAIDAIMPIVDDIFSKTLKSILERCHSVLKKEDKKYRIAANKSGAEYSPKGLIGYKKSLENVVATGRYIQTAAPLIQVDPQSAIVVDVEARLKSLARELGLDDVIKPRKDIQDERQAIADRKQQQAQAEQQQMQAQTGKLEAEAVEKGGQPSVQQEGL